MRLDGRRGKWRCVYPAPFQDVTAGPAEGVTPRFSPLGNGPPDGLPYGGPSENSLGGASSCRSR